MSNPLPHWTITQATALPGLRLSLRFADGTAGTVTLEAGELTGVLARLRDAEYFAQVLLLDGVPTWPCGEDLAPDALYADVCRAKGVA